jgi:hydroxyacylglutathione hydrolase
VPGQTVFAADGDVVTVGKELSAEVILNPGHTSGAISYYLKDPGLVFTGDTLFAAGCGRLFEGSAEQMHKSLSRLMTLPADTKVYCGHEYTESNLRFASAAEPDNPAIGERLAAVSAARKQGDTSMGFTIADELATNVFVRTDQAQVREAALREGPAEGEDAAQIFGGLRAWKDRF